MYHSCYTSGNRGQDRGLSPYQSGGKKQNPFLSDLLIHLSKCVVSACRVKVPGEALMPLWSLHSNRGSETIELLRS